MDHRQYLEAVQCSAQWRPFLAALAEELASQTGAEELRPVMRRIGARMVTDWPALDCDSLEGLEGAVNAIWRGMDWGWVAMQDQGDRIDLTHFASPLRAAFGDQVMSWVPALLEGVYGELFGSMGADAALVVRQLPAEQDDAGSLRFCFGREPG